MKSLLEINASANRSMKARAAMRRRFITFTGALLALAFVAIFGSIVSDQEAEAGMKTTSAAVLGIGFAFAGGLREEDNDGPDGGGDPTVRLIEKVSKNIDAVGEKMKDIEAKAADVPELKKELEALQKAVRDFEGLDADVKAFTEAQSKLDTKLKNIRFDVEGNPLKRILGDAEKCALITAPARAAFLRHNNKAVPKEVEELAERMALISEARALTTGATPGSAYVDDELMTEVYQLAATYGVWNQFDVQRPGAGVVKLPVDTTDPLVLWETEGTGGSERSFAGSTVTLNIKEAIGWISVSNALLEDDVTGLASRLLTKFSRANALRLDHTAIAADGTDDGVDGLFEGIFDAGSAVALGTGDIAFSNITFDDFIALQAGSNEALVGLPSTRWLLHPHVLVRLLAIKDDNGRPIFQTALDAPSQTAIGSILGDGVVRSVAAPKTAGASLPIVGYGDMLGMAVAIRKDMEFASSTEAQFLNNKTVFRSVMRGGVKLRQASAWSIMTFGAAS